MPVIEGAGAEGRHKNHRTFEPRDHKESITDERGSDGTAMRSGASRQVRGAKVLQSGDTALRRADQLPVMAQSCKDDALSPNGVGVKGNASLALMLQSSNQSASSKKRADADQIRLPEMLKDTRVAYSQSGKKGLKELNLSQSKTARGASSRLECEDSHASSIHQTLTPLAQPGKHSKVKRRGSQNTNSSGSDGNRGHYHHPARR